MLHILRKAPQQTEISRLLSLLRKGDVVLLMHDGVFCGQPTGVLTTLLCDAAFSVYALAVDVAARGFQVHLDPAIELVDYHQFIDLTAQHAQLMYW